MNINEKQINDTDYLKGKLIYHTNLNVIGRIMSNLKIGGKDTKHENELYIRVLVENKYCSGNKSTNYWLTERNLSNFLILEDNYGTINEFLQDKLEKDVNKFYADLNPNEYQISFLDLLNDY